MPSFSKIAFCATVAIVQGRSLRASAPTAGTCSSFAMNSLSEASCTNLTTQSDCASTSPCLWTASEASLNATVSNSTVSPTDALNDNSKDETEDDKKDTLVNERPPSDVNGVNVATDNNAIKPPTTLRSLLAVGPSCHQWDGMSSTGCAVGFDCQRLLGNTEQTGHCVSRQCFQNLGQFGCKTMSGKSADDAGCFATKDECDAQYNKVPDSCYPSDNPTCSYTVIDTHQGNCWATHSECLEHAPQLTPAQNFCFAPKGSICAGLQEAPSEGCYETMVDCQDEVAKQHQDEGSCWTPKLDSAIASLSTGASWCHGNCVPGNEANCEQMCQKCP